MSIYSLRNIPYLKGKLKRKIINLGFFVLGHLGNFCYGLESVVVHCPSCVVCRPSCVNVLFSRTIGPILTKLVCGICRVRKYCKLMTPIPKGDNFGIKSEKLMYFFKAPLLYSRHGSGKISI